MSAMNRDKGVTGSKLVVIGTPGRYIVKQPRNTAKVFSKEVMVKVKLETPDIVEDAFAKIKVGDKAYAVGVSPICRGCKSRDHVIGGCPWIGKDRRIENSLESQFEIVQQRSKERLEKPRLRDDVD